jgi:anti-anti-sigma factor
MSFGFPEADQLSPFPGRFVLRVSAIALRLNRCENDARTTAGGADDVVRRLTGSDGCQQVAVTADDHGTRITLVGEIDMSCQAELDHAIHLVGRRASAPVTVDLADTDFLASCGVDFIAQLSNSVRPAGHTVTLLDPARIVRRVLDITGVSAHVRIASSAEPDTG